MKQIQKKLDRKYVISDSSVNEYGFRLLTSGYQADAFQKNPIGYYMHRREDDVVLKWEDLQVDDDKITGVPVINLSNIRGIQTCDEAENGFLNAASVGHIVVLEYSNDPELMLPGQTGPTITRWYNKECSLVDIPGNCNALTRLYDAQENEINLVDLHIEPLSAKRFRQGTLKELNGLLQLPEEGSEKEIIASLQNLQLKLTDTDQENIALRQENQALQQQLEQLTRDQTGAEINRILNNALESRKITVELRDKLAADYASNPTGLQALISAMPAYRSITDYLKHKQADQSEAQWHWDDFEKNDPSGIRLKTLKATDPARYQELFDEKFRPAA